MKYLLAFALSFASAAQAATVYKFYLRANKQVAESCTAPEEGETFSKINVSFKSAGAVTTLKLKAKICTVGYGYRRVDLAVNIPKEVTQAAFLTELKNGEAKTFKAIPMVGQASKKNDVVVKRLAAQGTLIPYEVSWKPGADGKTPFAPVRFFRETDPAKAQRLARIAGASFPWARLQYSFSHAWVSTPFFLDGALKEASEEN